MRFDCKEKIDALNDYKNIAKRIADIDPVQASKLRYISIYKDQVSLEPGILREDIQKVELFTHSANVMFDKLLQGFLKTKQDTKEMLNKSISNLLDIGICELNKKLNGKKVKKLLMNTR